MSRSLLRAFEGICHLVPTRRRGLCPAMPSCPRVPPSYLSPLVATQMKWTNVRRNRIFGWPFPLSAVLCRLQPGSNQSSAKALQDQFTPMNFGLRICSVCEYSLPWYSSAGCKLVLEVLNLRNCGMHSVHGYLILPWISRLWCCWETQHVFCVQWSDQRPHQVHLRGCGNWFRLASPVQCIARGHCLVQHFRSVGSLQLTSPAQSLQFERTLYQWLSSSREQTLFPAEDVNFNPSSWDEPSSAEGSQLVRLPLNCAYCWSSKSSADSSGRLLSNSCCLRNKTSSCNSSHLRLTSSCRKRYLTKIRNGCQECGTWKRDWTHVSMFMSSIEYSVVTSQTLSWVSQKRLLSEAGISLFIESFHAI